MMKEKIQAEVIEARLQKQFERTTTMLCTGSKIFLER